MGPRDSKDRKVFVTVGTTVFDPLISAVLTPAVISVLHSQKYTSIRMQYGKGVDIYQGCYTPELEALISNTGIDISGFAYADGEEITREFKSSELIISHAGSGSILEALRYEKRIIVIPNESLMDNHQAELADEMARQKYVIKGSLKDLAPAIENSLNFKFKHFPRTGSKVFAEVLEEEIEKADKDKMYG